MCMLLEVVQQARQRLGFHTNLEIGGPAESKSNGRVEREIQTVRGRARIHSTWAQRRLPNASEAIVHQFGFGQ